jgi:hypothetical protein
MRSNLSEAKTCAAKTAKGLAFTRFRKANEYLIGIRRWDPKTPIRPYRCPHCGKWHVGKKTPWDGE